MYKKNLALLLMAMLVTGCGGATTETTAEAGGAAQTDATTETETELRDNLPDGLDYEGYVCNVLVRENPHINFRITTEELTGEGFNDAIFNREKAVEERLNIDLVDIPSTDNNYLQSYILGGDSTFDFADLRCSVAVDYFLNGYTYTYDQIPFVDLSKPWWDASVNSALTLGGIQYTASSAMNMTLYDFVDVLLFNKQMIEDNSLEDPYTVVHEGRWTMDAMEEMMATVTTDTNGDGKMDKEDTYGYVCAAKNVLPSFWLAADTLTVIRDENDMPVLNMNSEKYIDVFNRIYAMTRDSGAWYVESNDDNVPQSSIDLFKANQTLFSQSTFFYVPTFRDMDTDFGIIPYPKYDEAQKTYISRLSFYDTYGVPVTTTTLDRTGTILEALAFESYITVVPAYYEQALKTKSSRDVESAEMLDLIFDARVIDMGDTAWVDIIRDQVLSPMFKADNRDLASKVVSIEKSVNTKIADMTEAIAALGK